MERGSKSDDTIAAISSAVGPAARMIVRVSGERAFALGQALCPGWTAAHGTAVRVSMRLEDLWVPIWIYAFQSPRSYTGEDSVEFHIPGNPLLARLLLDELLRQGARSAEAGEFTARAYFAGKLDLTEAEGVAATIAASNEDELRAGRRLLVGELARRLRPAMDRITQTLALVEVGIDFSEEDVTFLAGYEIHRRVEETDEELSKLLEESTRFERLVHEPRIVLLGRPNAGKSTLVNALIGRARSIVSNIAGTTRDVLTAELDLARGRVQLLDVAGIEAGEASPTADPIERQMRAQAIRAVEAAEHVVLVRESGDAGPPPALDRPVDLTVMSKSDLLDDASPSSIEGAIAVSARTGQGLAELREALDRIAFGGAALGSSLALNRRHVACVEEARAALARVNDRVHDGAAELIALELREALDALGRVLGNVTPDDVLGLVFSSFCIGK